MGTHPIFESDFDCLTDYFKMNRLLARPVMQTLSRRTILSSGKTGGHGWYREGYTLFSAHPAMYRYIGLGLLIGTPLPFLVLWDDYIFNDCKIQEPIEKAIFPEILSFMNLTQCAMVLAIVGHWTGRCLAFNNMNMWGQLNKQLL